MAKTFKNTKELFAYLQKQNQSVLNNEIAKLATKSIQEAVEEDTYTEYAPDPEPTDPYIRRGRSGGLADIHNYTVEKIDDNTISVSNDTTGNSNYKGYERGSIDKIIVTGRGYQWRNSEIYSLQPFPRNFYAGAIVRMKENNRFLNTFKDGLRKRGLDVR